MDQFHSILCRDARWSRLIEIVILYFLICLEFLMGPGNRLKCSVSLLHLSNSIFMHQWLHVLGIFCAIAITPCCDITVNLDNLPWIKFCKFCQDVALVLSKCCCFAPPLLDNVQHFVAEQAKSDLKWWRDQLGIVGDNYYVYVMKGAILTIFYGLVSR